MSNILWSVYVHTNKVNGKRYVGITSQQPEKRWLNGRGYDSHLPIGRAIEKYGWENFEHDILYSDVTEREAKELEASLIKLYSTQDKQYGYNLTAGGDGLSGFHHTDEAKRKMSVQKKASNHPNYGKHLREITRSKISEKLIGNSNSAGIVRSEETKMKMSRSKMKPVIMLIEDTPIRIFDSAKSAENETGISRKNISLCCYNQRQHAGGYAWKFA